MKKSHTTIIFLTLFLISFALWVSFADKVKSSYVKNILKSWKSSLESNLERSNIITWNLEKVWIIDSHDLDLTNFWTTYQIIKNNYYDLEGIKKQDLVDGMSKGLIDAIWDKHSEFLTKTENEDFSKMLSGDFEWIWAVVDKLDFWVKIERILKGSPAEKFGLLNNDIIIEADNEELAELSLFDAVAKIKGPAGTKVVLKILRSWENEALDIEVIRDKIKIPSIEEKYFEEENIGYIALNMFWEETSQDFTTALNNVVEKNPEGLIIDLRNNGWWYLLSAVEILSEFIDNWELLVTTKYKEKMQNEVYTSSNFWGKFEKKIVVIINGSSASASEITAGALREYNKAIVVWEKSYGKWSVQKPFMLDDWSMVKLTIAKWYTPLDKSIDLEWITPDIEVSIEKQDYNLEECKKVWKCEESLEQKDFEIYDRQLEEAKTILKSFISNWNLQVVVDEENERLWNVEEKENNVEKDWQE